jgi:phage portal protein BeeE
MSCPAGWSTSRSPRTAAGYRIGSLDVTEDMLHIPYQIAEGEAHGHGPLEAGRGAGRRGERVEPLRDDGRRRRRHPQRRADHPHNLDATQAQDLQMAWVTARMSSMGLPAVLSGGIDFETVQFSPKDMALLELAQFNESRIAVLLGVAAVPRGCRRVVTR